MLYEIKSSQYVLRNYENLLFVYFADNITQMIPPVALK